ncbi:hypothetical protein [Pimelobacter simplex]|uniref:hypothetical protein n=1 Tax=Nocardioides simplex TaxID=2045 RepID=UPI00214FCCBE|nr:hypothetical protein [Pimelobacter simplex]UUW92256.1 hypothetical protein M0M43_12470 [Pimelobacter simplex]UUW96083.1 hypothetical protein M0M48_01100 [Pimelobacter simplex]
MQIQKTGRLDHLPITNDLEVELRHYLVWYAGRLARRGTALAPQSYLFPALGPCNSVRDGDGSPLQYGDPQPDRRQTHPARVVHRALRRIGIEDSTYQGFHTIRRSVGRVLFDNLAEDGQDNALRLTASLLGHKNVATTELYLGIDKDREKRNAYLRGRSLLAKPDANVTPIGRAR